MRVVITGAGGFLGRHLVRELIACGDVDVLGVSSGGALCQHPSLRWSGRESALQRGFIEQEDVVIACAFPRGCSGRDFGEGVDYVTGVMRNAKNSNVAAFLNISSQSVYGNERLRPSREDDPVCPVDVYAATKYMTEKLADCVFDDLPHSNIRLASLIGPGFDQRVVNKMAQRAVEGKGLVVKEAGSRYGFLDVRDAAKGISCMAKSPLADNDAIYNIGIEHGYTLTELATHVAARAKTFAGYVPIEEQSLEQHEYTTALDCGKFRLKFGWKPKFTLDMTIDSILEEKCCEVK